jgi:hypothetical protein
VRLDEAPPARRRAAIPFTVAFLVLAFGTIAGAVAGAALRPTPANRHVAEAAVVAAGAGSSVEVRRLAGLIGLPYVHTLARAQLGEQPGFQPDVSIEQRPELGMVAIRVSAGASEVARLFADALASQAIAFRDVVTGTKGAAIPLGDFEEGYGGWIGGPRTLGATTGNITLALDDPRFNDAAVDVNCEGSNPCGFSRLVHYPFRSGVRYQFVGWAQGDAGDELELAVGVPGDTAASELTLSSRWRRVAVSWVPGLDHQSAELRWQASAGVEGFSLDGVWMADAAAFLSAGSPFPSGPAEAAVFRERDVPRAFPAVDAGTVESRTLRAALLGALLGLLGGSVALGLLVVSRRR